MAINELDTVCYGLVMRFCVCAVVGGGVRSEYGFNNLTLNENTQKKST